MRLCCFSLPLTMVYVHSKCEARNAARPQERGRQPVEKDVHLSRRARRLLSSTGAVQPRVPQLREEACAAAGRLWELCDRRQVVVWLDNWYRKRFGTDPITNDLSLNVSVLAVLHTTALPQFPGQLSAVDVLSGLPAVAQRLLETHTEIRRGVRCVNEEALQPEWIRVPLDIQRTGMRSLQWLPYLLTPLTVSSQIDLVQILDNLEPLRTRSRHCMPLLVDMDIHYRVMKMMYGESLCKWNFRRSLTSTPILYGVCQSITVSLCL